MSLNVIGLSWGFTEYGFLSVQNFSGRYGIQLFMTPAWKARRGYLANGSVHLFILHSVPLTYIVQYLKFGWWYSHQTWTVISSKGCSLLTDITCMVWCVVKMAAPESDWPSHFWLLLWNCWKEFKETRQVARFQRPLPMLCFLGGLEKQDGLLGSVIGWDIFDFSSETAERNSTKLDRKQDLNILYQVYAFGADRKHKLPWPICQQRWHIVLGCTICGPLGLLLYDIKIM